MKEGDIPVIEEKGDDIRDARDIYNGFLLKLTEAKDNSDRDRQRSAILDTAKGIIGTVTSRRATLFLYISRYFKENYLFAHSLNVALLSVRIGLVLGFDEKRLERMGSLALTHSGEDMGLPEDIFAGVENDKETDEVIKLADIYDTLSNPPSYRQGMTPPETITAIIDVYGSFDQRLVKSFLKEITFYPEGSWVELNTKAIGMVVKVNVNFPMRPVVDVVTAGKQTIDLSKNMLIYIARALTLAEIEKVENDILDGKF